MSGSGPLERELAIYNWSDYIGDTTIADFERETGVRVIYDTYESNEDLIAKLQAGATGYDLVVPTGYAVRVLRALDLLSSPRPLGAHRTTGRISIRDSSGHRSIRENEYTVPWLWGSSGLAVRTDLVKERPDSWGVFLDPRYRGKMTQLDDMRDVIGDLAQVPGPFAQFDRDRGAAAGQGRRDLGQAQPQVVRLGAGQGAAHRG